MVAQTHITMVGAFSPKPYNAPIPKCTATNHIFLETVIVADLTNLACIRH